jgi:O-antigen/teichoic acid export membrane protein
MVGRMAEGGGAPVDAVADSDAPSATLLAIRNALKLGASLLFTWGIALSIRVLLPRYLGPTRFGSLNFADGFTTAAFILLGLGSDSYIRKEVAVRPAHASDFFGAMFLLRVVMACLVLLGLGAVLKVTGRTGDLMGLVMLYGVTQFFVNANLTLSAILHAKGRVGAMSVLAVVTKVVWAAGVLYAMLTNGPLWLYAASYLASESVETVVLYRLAYDHVGLRFRVDVAATRAVLVASLPYYVNLFATTAYGKLDVSLLEFMGSTEEVGWYGSANAIASLTLLITPLIGWVLMPMFARAAARSRAELDEQVRRALELILSVAIPAGLMIHLGADVWVHLMFGAAFAPAAKALRVLAPMFVIMYVGIIYSIALVMLERAWALVVIALGGLAVNVVLNMILIRFSMRVFGAGGGGMGCSIAMLSTEVFVTSAMLALLGRGGFDRRSVVSIAKSLASCAAVLVVDHFARPLGYGRLALDAALYAALVLGTGAVRIREVISVLKEALRRRSGQAAEESA